jgi:periplasmic divalent cation tolerance protein
LIEGKFAACANLLPLIESIYWWQGKIEEGKETLVLFKTSEDGYERFQSTLRELHPYEVPEIIALPINRGLPEYLQWVVSNCDG